MIVPPGFNWNDGERALEEMYQRRSDGATRILESLISELLNLDSPIPVSESLWDQCSDWTTGESWR